MDQISVASAYRSRVIDDEVTLALGGLAAIALEGIKAVGKTATALRRARTVYRLDIDAERQIAAADSGRLVRGDIPILIDEWQRLPASWDRVRRAVDGPPPAVPGSFILTGSANPANPPAHSGVGRIPVLRMRPMSLAERGISTPTVSMRQLLQGSAPVAGQSTLTLDEYVEEILASGFPAIRPLEPRLRRLQLDGYIARVIDRDVEESGRPIRRSRTLRRWLAAYAAATATTATYEKIRAAAAGGRREPPPARTTSLAYREVLERIFVLDPLNAWEPGFDNLGRLGGAPKHHLADPALVSRILGVGADDLLAGRSAGPPLPRDGTLLGALFESLVVQSVRVYAQAAEATTWHLRTRDGAHDVDIIVLGEGNRVLALECKLGPLAGPAELRHLLWLRRRIGDQLADAAVITSGSEAYRTREGVAVIPAALLGP